MNDPTHDAVGDYYYYSDGFIGMFAGCHATSGRLQQTTIDTHGRAVVEHQLLYIAAARGALRYRMTFQHSQVIQVHFDTEFHRMPLAEST